MALEAIPAGLKSDPETLNKPVLKLVPEAKDTNLNREFRAGLEALGVVASNARSNEALMTQRPSSFLPTTRVANGQ